MGDRIQEAIKKAEQIVRESGVNEKFAASAYEVVLSHLLHTDGVVGVSAPNALPQKSETQEGTLGFRPLYESKMPQSVYRLIALVVFYLENTKSNEEGNDTVASSERIIEFLEKECFAYIKDKDFGSLKQRIIDTASKKYGYITKVKDTGAYVLTPKGRKLLSKLPEEKQKKG